MPLLVLAALAIVGVGVGAAALSYTLRHRMAVRGGEGHNDITGFIFATVSVLYSVLLAFVVIAVWERFTETEHAVATEASLMVAAYRDTEGFPEPQRSQAQDAYREFATAVVTDEWADQIDVEVSSAPDALNAIHAAYSAIEPEDQLQTLRLVAAESDLHDLGVARQSRHMTVDIRLAPVFWLVLGIGALITMTFVFLFDFASRRVHAALTGLLAGAIVAVLCLVVSLDRPYEGYMQVSKFPFENALQEFDAIDIPAS
ncbi:MAG: DUF4239 domain-containing protein [Cellulomonadaceae bacterium]|nr:DUF4239 domain-containing protein [Cellulomonadaceae bacterium]